MTNQDAYNIDLDELRGGNRSTVKGCSLREKTQRHLPPRNCGADRQHGKSHN